MQEPFDPRFNVAVVTMAGKVCPTGYDVGANAPNSLDELRDHVERTGRILVWNGESDATIFGDAEVNWAFRAWHDWTHLVIGAEFTLDGELAVAHRQIQDLTLVYGHTSLTREWAKIIMAEVYGQAVYHHKLGVFPAGQVAFDLTYIGS